ncbi:MAG: carbon-nitrogen hydrolase family protein [Sulfobacillus acidophilus]|uniref:Carbon-nitrogen hydrolase family protein n=1 Tax=Sulfobacillus acidophilus TaxID=53633 RepID=A0A2T2WGS4_9FIRM|nr:MAG: carbon-nitrogen hydrolase family protein [Sulfobacillus acidophilus]
MPRIALGQMEVQWGNPDVNLSRAVSVVAEARRQNADLVVLPECMDLGWLAPEAATKAEPLGGPRTQALQDAARAGIFIVAGLTERVGARIYNTAVLIDRDGIITLVHHKINELVEGQQLYTRGTSLGTAMTPWGLAGIPICADNFVQSRVLGEALGWMGTRWLFSPCAWAVSADNIQSQDEYLAFWLESYRYLAKNYRMTVVAVSNVGVLRGGAWDGWHCIGSSVVVGPDGQVVERAPYGVNADVLVVVDLPDDEKSDGWLTQ